MKKKFAVDVFRTVAHMFEIEAETEEEAIDITDDIDVEICGCDENGEMQYN